MIGEKMKPGKHGKKDQIRLSESSVASELGPVQTVEPKSQKQLYQAIVALREEKKMSERAIASELNVPKTTVHRYLAQWKQKTPMSELKKLVDLKSSPQQTNDSFDNSSPQIRIQL
jgi:DNA-binding transcriptional regulator YiaG